VRLQLLCGVVVAFLAGFTNVDALEEVINIGTLSAFVMVSLAVPVLRKKRPDLQRVQCFRVPLVPWLPLLSAVLCLYLMLNLATLTWLRFGIWMVLGVAVYLAYGARHSRLREVNTP
jgi:APA family basic amino acid/polyamine antiporter